MDREHQLPCWQHWCPERFDTFTLMCDHHLHAHHIPLRRDGTPLVPCDLPAVIGYASTVPRRWPDVRTLTEPRSLARNGQEPH
jgi:hypothetical protein